jgi:hypothetical protein
MDIVAATVIVIIIIIIIIIMTTFPENRLLDRPLDPSSLVSNGNRILPLGRIGCVAKLTTHHHITPRSRMIELYFGSLSAFMAYS